MTRNQIGTRVSKISLLGTFVPRKCGIATYSQDLALALSQADPRVRVDSVAVSDQEYDYPGMVCEAIPAEDSASYGTAAASLNSRGYDVLSIQHEYGIFGGEAGSYVLQLARQAKMPLVTTLHTVLRSPSSAQRAVLEELLQLSSRIVVMSRTAIDLLIEVHGVDRSRIDFIPHGIPRIPDHAGAALREQIGSDGPILLTFGLLSPDKGLESVIRALPDLKEHYPNVRYLIVGATHPHVLAKDGERYRDGLLDLANTLGVEENVVFVNEFVSLERLTEYLSATDFYVTPYLNPMQITSGTLAYSMGAGKVVLSTPYAYAQEVLADGRGVLVPFGCSKSIAEAILESWQDREKSAEMARLARAYGEEMHWERIGELYLDCFERAVAESKTLLHQSVPLDLKSLPNVKLDHLLKMTDDTGLLQHATYSVPNRKEGYCTDDNARALILTVQLGTLEPELRLRKLQSQYLAFVVDSFDEETGCFRNFMNYRREWLEDRGSEDSQGRALWALGELVGAGGDPGHVNLAQGVFDRAASALVETTSPRTWAYAALGSAALIRQVPTSINARCLLMLFGQRLRDAFQNCESDDWPWMEQRLAYANARIPQALIVAGDICRRPEWVAKGLDVLSWLMRQQTAPSGCFSPVGSEGAGPDEIGIVQYDQQPVETWASVSACLTASRFGEFDQFRTLAQWSFSWFLGRNVLGLPMCQPESGACFDGLQRNGLNWNQGAESTLSYLCALTEIKLARRGVTASIVRG